MKTSASAPRCADIAREAAIKSGGHGVNELLGQHSSSVKAVTSDLTSRLTCVTDNKEKQQQFAATLMVAANKRRK